MEQRPYIQYDSYELADLVAKHNDSLEMLETIYYELTFRKKSKYAKSLREQVRQRIESRKALDDFPARTVAFFDSAGYNLDDLATEFGIDEARNNLNYRLVAVTGSGPYAESLVRTLVFFANGINSDLEMWEDNMLIVLGRENFDKERLKFTIQFAIDHEFKLEFMTQEDFNNYLAPSGEFSPYFPGDTRIWAHPGLDFVASIGFKWPKIISTSQKSSSKSSTEDRSGYDERKGHPLTVKYGYSVAKNTGLSEGERHQRLRHAVNELGLQEVVFHISDLVNERKLTQPEKMKDAIYLWKKDLAWLKRTYYLNSIYSFNWPDY